MTLIYRAGAKRPCDIPILLIRLSVSGFERISEGEEGTFQRQSLRVCASRWRPRIPPGSRESFTVFHEILEFPVHDASNTHANDDGL
jgi:hypothetical protein